MTKKKTPASRSLKAIRMLSQKTQSEIALAMGTHQGEISVLEGRESLETVRVGTLERYAEAMGGALELAIILDGDRFVIDQEQK